MKDKEFEDISERHSFKKQISNDSKFFKDNILANKEELEEFQPIYEPYIRTMIEKDLKEFVIFKKPTEKATKDIIELVGFQSGINNTYTDTNCILFLNYYFPINTVFYKNKVINGDLVYDIIDTNGIKSLKRKYKATKNIF